LLQQFPPLLGPGLRLALPQARTHERAVEPPYASVALGRGRKPSRVAAGSAAAAVMRWSRDYRMFFARRWQAERLFDSGPSMNICRAIPRRPVGGGSAMGRPTHAQDGARRFPGTAWQAIPISPSLTNVNGLFGLRSCRHRCVSTTGKVYPRADIPVRFQEASRRRNGQVAQVAGAEQWSISRLTDSAEAAQHLAEKLVAIAA